MDLKNNNKYYVLIEDVIEPFMVYVLKNGKFENEKTQVSYPIEKIVDYCHIDNNNLEEWKTKVTIY